MRDVAILSGVAVIGVAAGWILSQLRQNPAEVERRRCAKVQSAGRLIDGSCTDVQGTIVHYHYVWRGVEYSSAQDLAAFGDVLPDPAERIVGPITVKFLPKDPSNSVIFADGWCGFRRPTGGREGGVETVPPFAP